MNNYSKVITFFMENGVQLTKEQLETLKEEFFEERAQSGALNKLVNLRKDQATELADKGMKDEAKAIVNKPIVHGSETGAGFRHVDLDENEPMTDSLARQRRKYAKYSLGQGIKSKEREPGEYFKKQEEKRNK